MSLERKIKGMHSVVSAKGPKYSHLFWFCSEAKDHSILNKSETSSYKFLTDVTSHEDCGILNKRNHLSAFL